MLDKVILGLDVDTMDDVKRILDLCPQCAWFKVGSHYLLVGVINLYPCSKNGKRKYSLT
jgi:orotidine-5'-phosphate decarboxylase